MSNNLLLTLDDATKVTMRFLKDYSHLGKDDLEDLKEVVYSELEQYCYIGNVSEKLKYILSEINPQSIANEIANDGLSGWCTAMQVELQRYMKGD